MKNISKRGFTLIELLVVTSIISLLSSVVLSAVNSARGKAENTARNRVAEEYLKAFALYASDNNGNYPSTGSTQFCLGEYAIVPPSIGNACGLNGTTFVSNSLNAALAPYFGGTASSLPVMVPFTLFGALGPFYTSYEYPIYENVPGNSPARIYWVLRGTSQKCTQGAIGSWFLGGTTMCMLMLQ